MTEPVEQGCAVQGKTRFLITFADSIPNGGDLQVNGRSDSPSGSSVADDNFTIDENFFAGSTLASVGRVPTELSAQAAHAEGNDESVLSFSAEPLLSSSPDASDSYVILMSTEDMGKLGVFSGDWCIAGSSDDTSRLVQVRSIDRPRNSTSGRSSGLRVYAPPQLLYNCGIRLNKGNALPIRASPFGTGPPSIPIARTVTLARIASPLSLDKTGHSIALKALKAKLGASKCLAKEGDIIAVTVGMDDTIELDESIDDASTEEEYDEVFKTSIDADNHSSSNIVYFVVSSLEYDVPKSSVDSGVDEFSRTASGELGCWIDSSVTRVVQVGLEHLPTPHTRHNPSTNADFDVGSFNGCFSKISELISAALEKDAAAFGLDLAILLRGPGESVVMTLVDTVARCLGFHLLEVSAFDIVGESDTRTEARLKDEFEVAMSCSPCIFLLRDVDGLMQTTQSDMSKEPTVVQAFQECIDKLASNWRETGFPVAVIATTSQPERLSASMLSCFKHEVTFEAPDEPGRYALLKSSISKEMLADDVSLGDLAVQTAAFTDDDLNHLISLMHLNAAERSMVDTRENMISVRSGKLILNEDDCTGAVEKSRISFSQNIGAPSIPKVSWSDVGGLASVKQDILDTIQLPLDNPSLFADGLKKRSGILLYGPPGTGKTLLAKAVATSCSLNFFSVKGPELLNMYIGESEANVRRVFQRAREARPCVIFFDELDSVAPKRGNHGDSGGVMDRIVSQLLAELDGMSSSKAGTDVFVIGATNRPDLLDPALLRPGRFDRLLYLGVSNTHEAQLNILEALTRKFRLDPQLNLMSIAELCPFNYTGADFYALCSDAMLKAMARKAHSVEETIKRLNEGPRLPNHQYPLTPQYYLSELASPRETDVVVSEIDFKEALQELVPSVSQAEMEHYNEIQQRFSGDSGRDQVI
ncbi:AAA-domain-containing protein [Fomitiporia mediterranea MF3/22]|uniref:AAA-domain-containing protein n=1 Tax=Fomitiporia mediterranea (strain MF3/22) TaxID=694068 RepID=UPI0004407394|nr:AAA-domain-containing protein [Fomitiporia mediterranea MF3/22]EJD02070.1 AAA-domain-containing protein [Fomitiporia mediterranea MF3/22]